MFGRSETPAAVGVSNDVSHLTYGGRSGHGMTLDCRRWAPGAARSSSVAKRRDVAAIAATALSRRRADAAG